MAQINNNKQFTKITMTQHSGRELSHENIQKVMASGDIPTCPAKLTISMQEGQKDLSGRVALATEDAAA